MRMIRLGGHDDWTAGLGGGSVVDAVAPAWRRARSKGRYAIPPIVLTLPLCVSLTLHTTTTTVQSQRTAHCYLLRRPSTNSLVSTPLIFPFSFTTFSLPALLLSCCRQKLLVKMMLYLSQNPISAVLSTSLSLQCAQPMLH